MGSRAHAMKHAQARNVTAHNAPPALAAARLLADIKYSQTIRAADQISNKRLADVAVKTTALATPPAADAAPHNAMPASLERLVAEAEPGVITDDVIRECLVVDGDAELASAKRRALALADATAAAFSFRRLAAISNLQGLETLTTLRLDNNRITRIEGLSHLTNLTQLDLSFNAIAAIEGLERLTRLQDLSLFSNRVAQLGPGLDALQGSLQALSLANNQLGDLAGTARRLARFTGLRMLGLAGNPLAGGGATSTSSSNNHPAAAAAAAATYRGVVLAHLPQLVFLDHRRATEAEHAAARDANQDAVAALRERQEAAAAEAAAAEARAAHLAAMELANLDGVETLPDDCVAADGEWRRLLLLPGLLEPAWPDAREKLLAAGSELKATVLALRARAGAERAQFEAARDAALAERDAEAAAMLAAHGRARKQMLPLLRPVVDAAARQRAEDEEGDGGGASSSSPLRADAVAAAAVTIDADAAGDEVLAAKVRLMALRDALLALEADGADAAADLAQEHDRAQAELAEQARLAYNSYFAATRDASTNFFAAVTAAAPGLVERFGGGGAGHGGAGSMSGGPSSSFLIMGSGGSVTGGVFGAATTAATDGGGDGGSSGDAAGGSAEDAAAQLLGDREALLGALQASQDAHAAVLDALEDRLLGREAARAAAAADDGERWRARRHRDRVAEVLLLVERGVAELDALAAAVEAAVEAAAEGDDGDVDGGDDDEERKAAAAAVGAAAASS